jgi:hypothetical protein
MFGGTVAVLTGLDERLRCFVLKKKWGTEDGYVAQLWRQQVVLQN